jgi:hypothetical protein
MLLDPDPHSQYGSGSSAGIFRQSMGARNRVGIGLSHRPARLHRLAESIPGLHKRLKIPTQDSQINANLYPQHCLQDFEMYFSRSVRGNCSLAGGQYCGEQHSLHGVRRLPEDGGRRRRGLAHRGAHRPTERLQRLPRRLLVQPRTLPHRACQVQVP